MDSVSDRAALSDAEVDAALAKVWSEYVATADSNPCNQIELEHAIYRAAYAAATRATAEACAKECSKLPAWCDWEHYAAACRKVGEA